MASGDAVAGRPGDVAGERFRVGRAFRIADVSRRFGEAPGEPRVGRARGRERRADMTGDHRPPRSASRGAHRRLPVVRHLVVRPSLSLALAVLIGLGAGLPHLVDWRGSTIVLVAWNAAAAVSIGLHFFMMAGSSAEAMGARAAVLDDGDEVILALSIVAGAAGLFAIVGDLGATKDAAAGLRRVHVALAGVTVVVAWTFIHVMFAVHYAHEWARRRHAPGGAGLRIPGEDDPDYWDFLYVAIVIGTSGQTADVEFTSKRMRRIGLVHSALAFFFNTGVLALSVNIAAGLV